VFYKKLEPKPKKQKKEKEPKPKKEKKDPDLKLSGWKSIEQVVGSSAEKDMHSRLALVFGTQYVCFMFVCLFCLFCLWLIMCFFFLENQSNKLFRE